MSGMQIFVKLYGGVTLTMDVEPTDSIENVKTKIEDLRGTPPSVQELLFQGRPLDEGHTLVEYDVQKETTIQLIPRKGVVTYEAVFASSPPLGGDQLAYLATGSVLSQQLVGINGGDTYTLGFYAEGTLHWSIEFFDASAASLGASTGDVTADPPGLSAAGLSIVAPAMATTATLSFAATSRSVLLDLVSFSAA